ncbi:TetR/AcrR family transcriptional regulator [Risungbinella massiliensis]|uniref:TetR/AcrR family transcriptional regulator n=1 Tax=Risungbinella massiliensis TaxID=1329796 RepID=UPI0005CC6922|nr:TetR/AcrR family transcriptional regulator [Risungbinella massiliensis]
MDGYQRRTELKKIKIRKAAFDLFTTYGVEKVSIVEIAKGANVSPVTIYNYFGSKDELLKNVIAEFMNESIEKYDEILEGNSPFPEKMEKIIFDGNETAKKLNLDFIQSNVNNPLILEFMDDFYQKKTLPLMIKMIEQGKKEGYVDQNISFDAILIYIQLFKEALAQPDFFAHTNQAVLLDLNRLFYYGLMGKPQTDVE